MKNNNSRLQIWWKSLCDTLFPRQCPVCGRRLALTESHVCATCLYRLPLVPCSDPADNVVTKAFEGFMPIEKATAMFYYHHESPYRKILFSLKYEGNPQIGREFGRMWARRLMSQHFFDGIDLLIPLPLANKRKRQRGYNQSEWIAKGITDITGIPVETDIVRRTVSNPTQTHLNKTDRYVNVEGIFQLSHAERLRGKHILLIDDVMTTGATLISCGRTLLAQAEDTRISIFVLAKTMQR